MTLPARQQHALDAIADVLQSAEPRLATMFGVFTDLTRHEAMPAAETLPPERWRDRRRRRGYLYRPGWLGQQRQHGRPGRRQHPGAGRLGRAVLLPLLFAAAASLVIVSLVSSGPGGRRGCGQAVAAVMAARIRGTVSGATDPGGSGSGSNGCRPAAAQPAAGKK